MIAYCYRSGEIEFAPTLDDAPDGTIPFLDSDKYGSDLSDDAFVALVEVRARLAYDGITYLVPGVPEAECQVSAATALLNWIAWAFPQVKAA